MNSGSWQSEVPSVYSIASGFYPEEAPKNGLEPRPCLITKVVRGRNTGLVRCFVAYGSGNLRVGLNAGHDLVISDKSDLSLVGLKKPTRFYLGDAFRVALPWDDTGFCVVRGKNTPIIGRLTESLIRDLQYCMIARASAE